MENNNFVYQLIRHFPKTEEHRIAFSLYDGQKITDIPYDQLQFDILKATGYFQEYGIFGKHIAILAPNSYNWLVAFFGIVASGNMAVLVNQDLPNEERLQHLQNADTTILCGNEADAAKYTVDSALPWLSFEQIVSGNAARLEDMVQIAPETTVALMATSGTTGQSKIAEISNQNLLNALEDYSTVNERYEKMLLTFPLFHISGVITAGMFIYMGRTVCLGRGIRYLFRDLPVLNISCVSMVPTLLDSFLKLLRAAKSKEQLHRIMGANLRGISLVGADVPPEIWRELMRYGIEEQIYYGMTESTGCGICCVVNETTMGSVGKPFGSTECRIENGELLLRGPAIMKGYYKDPEETAKVLRNGWLHTGDLAEIDENGNYHLIGRKKNVIILSNGENVNPEEIEAKFSQCKAIAESLVYSDGKGICADIYAPMGKEQAEEFIVAYNRSVPMYRQVYRRNYTTEPLEKTASGKVKRKENQ